jgi:hypothetical protein
MNPTAAEFLPVNDDSSSLHHAERAHMEWYSREFPSNPTFSMEVDPLAHIHGSNNMLDDFMEHPQPHRHDYNVGSSYMGHEYL